MVAAVTEVAADKDRSRERAIANWCMSFVRRTAERAAKMRDPALQTDDEPEDLTTSFNDDEDERYTGSMMEAWVQARVGDEGASYGHTDTFTHLQVCEAERRSWRLSASNRPMAAA